MKHSPQRVNPVSLGSNIQKLREEQGIRQFELALEIGLAPNSVSYYESGRSVPSLDLAVRIADYFQVALDFLLGRDEYASYSNATLQSVAKSLISLSRLKGIKVCPGENGEAARIEVSDDTLKRFLGDYYDAVAFLSTKKTFDGVDISENRIVRSIVDEMPTTPIEQVAMTPEEFRDLYRE